MIPLTPARPKNAGQIAAPSSTFASRQVLVSHNRQAATVLFTPRARRTPGPVSVPTPSHAQHTAGSDSDIESAFHSLRLQGPRSKQVAKPKRKGGAKDVWSFYEKKSGRSECVFCR